MELKRSTQNLAKNPKTLRWVVLAVAVVVGLVAWLLTRDGGDDPAPTATPAEPRIVSEEELTDIPTAVGHPVYWAGPIPDTELEVNEQEGGGVQVRYLNDGAEAGDESADFLTVGSYPLPDPAKALDEFAEREDAIVNAAPDGRKLVSSEEREGNVYFVNPENSVQVEVFDPDPERALEMAESGQVQPVG